MIRPCRYEDIPELRELWKKVFGDEDQFIDLFFKNLFRSNGGLVVQDEDKIAAMGFLVTIGIYKSMECQVTYAVACDPEYRCKGYGSQISSELAKIAGDGAVICPASAELFDFYRVRAGYETEFYVSEYNFDKTSLVQSEGSINRVTANEYAVIREQCLCSVPHIVFNDAAVRHQDDICSLANGGLFVLNLPSGTGCCAVEVWNGKIIVKELLVPDGEIQSAVWLIGNEFDGDEIIVRCPVRDTNQSRPFAMSKAGHNASMPMPWFGFAFD